MVRAGGWPSGVATGIGRFHSRDPEPCIGGGLQAFLCAIQFHVLPPFRWNTLFGQLMAPRVKEFATSNRANGFRLERDQRDGCAISVNKLDFVCRPLFVDVNDGTDITGVES